MHYTVRRREPWEKWVNSEKKEKQVCNLWYPGVSSCYVRLEKKKEQVSTFSTWESKEKEVLYRKGKGNRKEEETKRGSNQIAQKRVRIVQKKQVDPPSKVKLPDPVYQSRTRESIRTNDSKQQKKVKLSNQAAPRLAAACSPQPSSPSSPRCPPSPS